MKPTVKLEDENIFWTISAVCRALKDDKEKQDEFRERASACDTFEDILKIMKEYVEVI